MGHGMRTANICERGCRRGQQARNGGVRGWPTRRSGQFLALCAVAAVLAVVVPPAHGEEASSQPGTWAVVIGIDHYANGENLQSARADAGDMNQVLANDGVPPDHRLYLTDAQ